MKSIILNQKLKHLNRRWRDILTHLASLFLPDALTRQVVVVVDYADHGNNDGGGCDIGSGINNF